VKGRFERIFPPGIELGTWGVSNDSCLIPGASDSVGIVMRMRSIGISGEALLWSDNSLKRDKLEEIKGSLFGLWKNTPGNWLLGSSTASNLSDESSLVESSGEGMIGDAGCRHVCSMSNACGHGGSDMLCVRACKAGRNRGPGSVDFIALSNMAIVSLRTFLQSLGLSTRPVVSEVSLVVGSS